MSFPGFLSAFKNNPHINGGARLGLYAALLLALLNGIIYMLVIPPWQHYDEPNHFEYAWLLANRPGMPKSGDYDVEMHRVVARSMIDHNFFKNMGYLPDLNSTAQPAYIGAFSQLSDPPLYYLIASIPLRIFKLAGPYGNIDGQYRAVQVVSLVFYLVMILCAWGLVKEIAGPDHPLTWIVPTCIALLPSLNSIMTSINNDVGAITFFTFFLWGAVYLIKRGFSWKGLAWSLVGAGLCVFTKTNVAIAVPLLILAVTLSLIPDHRRWWIWGSLCIIILTGLLGVITWDDASGWNRATLQAKPSRILSSSAPLGRYVFQVVSTPDENTSLRSSLQQIVPVWDLPDLSNQPVTFGGWIWGSQAGTIRAPILQGNKSTISTSQNLNITQNPAFYTFQGTIPDNTAYLQVSLSPFLKTTLPGSTVYYDGLILLSGQWPVNQAPQFTDGNGTSGTWGGIPFTNMLQGASAEIAWPRFRNWIDRLGSRFLPDRERPSVVLYALLNWKNLWAFYSSVLDNLVRTFWAKFGWDKVSLLAGKPYRYLAYLMIAGLIGAALALWRNRRQAAWHLLIFLGLATLGVWAITFLMSTLYIFNGFYHAPARYAFPVIGPTLLLLSAGWLGWFPKKGRKIVQAVIPLGFFLINIFAVLSIYLYYKWE